MATISIIGSGFGGLSAALYCAKAWHEVHVYEKNDQLWGRASIYQADWFTWDMWPSWYLMPDLFEQFFADFDCNVHDYLHLTKLSPSYKIYFKDSVKHPSIDVYDDINKNEAIFESLEPWSTTQLKKYLQKAEYQYHVAMKDFVQKNYNSLGDFFTWRMLTEWVKLNVFSTIGSYVKKYFRSSEMQKIIQYPMVFLGSPLYKTPALYNLMTYVDFGMWVWYPQGGIHSIVSALVSIGKNLWVQYHTCSEVQKINVAPKKWKPSVYSITIDGAETLCDAIISNADMHWSETQLLDKKYQSYSNNYWGHKTIAPSGFILYLWISKKLSWLKHHTLVFSEDRNLNNQEIFDTKQPPSDPSFYICCPSKTDPSVAPPNCENLFVLVPFPPNVYLDKHELRAYRDKIISTLEKLIGQDIANNIIHERIFCVSDFESSYHAYQWTALGLAHTFMQTAVFRPNNKSKKITWLYYAWWYTNPGIGMPMCLISGKLAYERLQEGIY